MDGAIEALRPALHAAISELSLSVSDAQTDALLGYLELLQRWNAHYNLTSVRDPVHMLTQHLADCLAIITPLRREVGGARVRLLDVGSGGGLPGAIVAILNPDIDVTCVDTVGKKAAFVQQVAGELRLKNLRAAHARVEALDAPPFDVVASRAFASLADFVRLTRDRLAAGGVWLAMKGKSPQSEIEALPPDVTVFHVEQLSVPRLEAERCIVWMRRAA